MGAYGKPAMYMGEGGSIPFMGMLGEQFPEAQFVITASSARTRTPTARTSSWRSPTPSASRKPSPRSSPGTPRVRGPDRDNGPAPPAGGGWSRGPDRVMYRRLYVMYDVFMPTTLAITVRSAGAEGARPHCRICRLPASQTTFLRCYGLAIEARAQAPAAIRQRVFDTRRTGLKLDSLRSPQLWRTKSQLSLVAGSDDVDLRTDLRGQLLLRTTGWHTSGWRLSRATSQRSPGSVLNSANHRLTTPTITSRPAAASEEDEEVAAIGWLSPASASSR